jgi:hypothetical protein
MDDLKNVQRQAVAYLPAFVQAGITAHGAVVGGGLVAGVALDALLTAVLVAEGYIVANSTRRPPDASTTAFAFMTDFGLVGNILIQNTGIGDGVFDQNALRRAGRYTLLPATILSQSLLLST